MAGFDKSMLEEDEKILTKAQKCYKFIIPHFGTLMITIILLIVLPRYDVNYFINKIAPLLLLGMVFEEVFVMMYTLLNLMHFEFIITNKRLIYRQKHSKEIEFLPTKKIQDLFLGTIGAWGDLFGYVNRISIKVVDAKQRIFIDTCISNKKDLERAMKQARSKKARQEEQLIKEALAAREKKRENEEKTQEE